MNLELTEEQTWLRESVGEMLARSAGDDGLVPASAGDALWRELAEFGALDVGGDEGLGAVELALIAWSLGGRLAAVPFVDSAALAYVAPGHGRAALGLSEPGRSFTPAEPSTSLDGGCVTGEKSGVAFAGSVERLAVAAAGPDGPVLALVGAAGAGVSLEPESTLDPTLQPARVSLDSADAEPAAGAPVAEVSAVAGVLAAAEAVGAAAAVLELACTYAAQRRQFGQTIGSFQAIRHLLADMYVKVESSWSSVLYAAAALDEHEPDGLRTASIAKAYAGRATHEVAHGALQVFGGIAFTAEHPAHRFLRRIAARGAQFGTPREHERALGRSLAQRLEVPA
ncbi:MAG TPA: acyl-CoA dehydrogenase family protein [Gaiellaceae bacterium]|nr:acyl-CoA dehydrogenase family protein [Gaiellaceae bacterium]